MPLWGKSTSAASRPKFMPDDSNSDWARELAFASKAGWALKPGTKGTGNDNTSPEAEVLATVRGLSANANSRAQSELESSGMNLGLEAADVDFPHKGIINLL